MTPPPRVPERSAGFAPLGDYAGIGDGRSVALVAMDGSIDWWALPDLHAAPAFGGLLDPAAGGRITLAPVDPFRASRRYVGQTNVVETTYETDAGAVRVTDSLNTGVAGRLPWSELGRRIEGVHGSVRMAWEVAPGTALGTLAPWTSGDGLLHVDDLTIGVRTDGVGKQQLGDRSVHGEFTAHEGARHLLGVVATGGEPLQLAPPDAIDARIDRTVRGWQEWSDELRWDGPWADDVRRSALALKLLLYAPTGAIAAAATTSLPESADGRRNWDYRYTWVRDTAYTLDAFVRCHLHEEVHAAVSWLLATVERHGPRLRPFYTLDGELPGGAAFRDLPGYGGIGPVRDGNDAAGQLQLGPYGDIFQTVYLCVREGHVLDLRTARMLADLADRCCDDWQRQDAGMWELPDEQHFTLSKISCWQALDRAARLADLGQLASDGRRWRMEADRVRAWVHEHCWSEGRGAFTAWAGSDELDAGVLLGARFGFDRGPRMASTTQAVLNELGDGPFVYRSTSLRKQEKAFLACTFWAVEALAFTDEVEQAQRLMESALEATRPFFLLPEMVDPATGRAWGNVPQALSHLALINAASAVGEVKGARANMGGTISEGWVQLPGEPLSVPTARHLVIEQCTAQSGAPEVCDSVALLTSELVTNGVLHARTPLALRVAQLGEHLRVEVRDGNPVLPKARRFSTDASTGRGMRLLDALASSWGVTRIEEDGFSGKAVWFEMSLRPSAPGATGAAGSSDAALAAAFADVLHVDWMEDTEPL